MQIIDDSLTSMNIGQALLGRVESLEAQAQENLPYKGGGWRKVSSGEEKWIATSKPRSNSQKDYTSSRHGSQSKNERGKSIPRNDPSCRKKCEREVEPTSVFISVLGERRTKLWRKGSNRRKITCYIKNY